ncbi:response regulator transcription factor [Corallincola luteus]|uniref:DNA-binding response regulator n=4 Tax=Corallincola TaxID=1775176 RepID=A0A368NI03_9GAMM|nr:MULTISPECIES: response regulator transcription factor [Corallincola]RCU49274.1 DNA-binding response regulator [Corallincola holothuriorum]TAA47669.1 response regulator transcription factor [Corallincola spongiicola]TCI05653.1 response regulator transcription factor [Corallincola luteus]
MTAPDKGRILVVDDDLEIRDLLAAHLSKNGYDVDTVGDGIEMFNTYQEGHHHLVILDVMLPGDDGFTLCQRLRKQSDVPVIMLTASSDETDRVIGLEIGADDYIAKPFSPRELLARIKALLRRVRYTQRQQPRLLNFANWQLDITTRQVTHLDGEVLELSGADFNLLQLFLKHPNEVLDRDTISDTIRGREASPFDRSIDVQISRLRQRLRDSGKQPKLIKTIRGSGYVLAAEVAYES